MNESSLLPNDDGVTKSVKLVGGPEGLDGRYVPDEGQAFLRFDDTSSLDSRIQQDPRKRRYHNYRISFGGYYEYVGYY